ncbi:MAG: hypothetical protein ACTHQ3_17260 [Motilibacteraceae bacterium]
MDVLEAIIPPAVMCIIFIAVAVTAFRATDGARKRGASSRGRGRSTKR